MATIATATLAIAGAIWFGLLSLGAAIAYGPVGVAPREIGLSTGTVVAQSAIGLAVLIIVVALVQLVIVSSKPVETWFGRRRVPSYSYPYFFVKRPALIFLLVAALVLGGEAFRARSDIAAGQRTDPLLPTGLASPWSGQVADLAWVQERRAGAPELPACALYLGEAGGTVIVYDAAQKRTWRLPGSLLVVSARPDAESC